MTEEETIQDFAQRCVKLDMLIDMLSAGEQSNRVWTAVLISKLVEIGSEEENPLACMDEVIKALAASFYSKHGDKTFSM